MKNFDPVELGIMWDRLISITDEMVSALVRTSFSLLVREAGDLTCVLFDANGFCLANPSFGQPAFTGTAPQTINHMLQKYPAPTLKPDDVLITNDPWLGTGHLFDVSILRPVFLCGKHVGFTMTVSHLPDIGGIGFGTVAKQIFEEGLRIPVTKIVDSGQINNHLIEIIQQNVRQPEEVYGDLMSHIASNRVGEKYLLEFMEDYEIKNLESISYAITSQTEKAMREEIAKIPDGTYYKSIKVEGIDKPITLACSVKISGETVKINFEGTGASVPGGINVPFCYTRAFSLFSIKSLTIPEIPNNDGATNPISISAPSGCILNAKYPSASGGRHVIGHFVPSLIFGALVDVIPSRVQADCGMLSEINCMGIKQNGRTFSTVFFASGGYGAHQGLDGRSVTPGPGNMIACSTEIMELNTNISVLQKSLLMDSGGPGEFRGGVGQVIKLRNDTRNDLVISGLAGRDKFPPSGANGGKAGGLRTYQLNGKTISLKGRYNLCPQDILVLEEAGGGGFGNPKDRHSEKVLADFIEGYISFDSASKDYGVNIDVDQKNLLNSKISD